MHKVLQWFANLPAPLRHFLAVVAGTAATYFLSKIAQAGSIYAVDYLALGREAVDAGLLAGVGALLVLFGTPLTDAYGVGKKDDEVETVEDAVDPDSLPDPAVLERPEWSQPEPDPITVPEWIAIADEGDFTQDGDDLRAALEALAKPVASEVVEEQKRHTRKTLKTPQPAKPKPSKVRGVLRKASRRKTNTTNPYEITWWRGFKLDRRTISALEWAEKKSGVRIELAQGSYNPGGVSASGGTHDGGGVVDIKTIHLTRKQRIRLMHALKDAGFAAWHRSPPLFPYHIHAVLLGHRTASTSAKYQMVSYKNHRNGLVGDGWDSTYRPSPIPRWSHRRNKPYVPKAG